MTKTPPVKKVLIISLVAAGVLVVGVALWFLLRSESVVRVFRGNVRKLHNSAINELGAPKKPLPLKKPLSFMNEQALGSYKVVKKGIIENKDILEALGTKEYLQWTLEDTQAQDESPVRFCRLFVTYYTGNLDVMPPLPEECFIAAGNELLSKDNVILNLMYGEVEQQIPASFLLFARKEADYSRSKYPIIYFFKVNDAYKGNARKARLETHEMKSEYSYFSKIDMVFLNNSGQKTIYPTKEEVIAASEKFLTVFLPVLEKDHWPEWKQ